MIDDDLVLDLILIAKELRRESDRGAAIIGHCLLDDFLRRYLKSAFPRDADDDIVARIFEGRNAPLLGMSNRNDFAYSLGLISKRIHADIQTINKIRIRFAHFVKEDGAIEAITFSTQRISHLCMNLSFYPEIDSAREKYTNTVFHLSALMSRAVSDGANSLLAGKISEAENARLATLRLRDIMNQPTSLGRLSAITNATSLDSGDK